jgi:hypothetical protein
VIGAKSRPITSITTEKNAMKADAWKIALVTGIADASQNRRPSREEWLITAKMNRSSRPIPLLGSLSSNRWRRVVWQRYDV